MDAAEYTAYLNDPEMIDAPLTVHISEVPGPARTLVYGYSRVYDAQHNESTHTVHVYKRDGELHLVRYDHTGKRHHAYSGTSLPLTDCKPQKRAYPERCDLTFARLMRAKGEPLCFTTPGSAGSNSEGLFAGRFIEDTH